MKVLFIYSGAESLGIEYISSFLKSKGHTTQLLFDPAIFSGDYFIDSPFLAEVFSVDEEIISSAVGLGPDLIAFSVYTGNYQWCLKVARRIRDRCNVPIVFGGVHPTAAPSEVLSHRFVDYVVVGEGEHAMLDLVEYLQAGGDRKERPPSIPNLGFRHSDTVFVNPPRPYLDDLDSLPFPDKNLFHDIVPPFARHYLIVTSRGCPYRCTYCSNSMYHALYRDQRKHVRRRSPHNVIQELLQSKQQRHITLVKFADDVFTSSEEWLREFIPAYRSEIGIPFFCNVHPMSVTAEIAELLKHGGCWFATMGVQSGSERIRRDIFRRPGSNQRILESVAHIKQAGIKLSIDSIFGAPSETEEDLEQSFELFRQAKADRILTFWLSFYPGTGILEHGKQHGVLTDADIQRLEQGEIGYTHDTGSVDSRKVDMYMSYQVMFQLRSLVHNATLFALLCKLAPYLPFKGPISKLILLLNGLKNRDVMLFNLLRYVCASTRTSRNVRKTLVMRHAAWRQE
jgi:anaerobic magnesium-protoporphyrin IX monomethyl ester cyclase